MQQIYQLSIYMKFYKLFFLLIFLSINIHSIAGQGFHAKGILGINASQLEGDNLSGFNKVGIQAGIGVEYEFVKNSIVMELLFNQKGSGNKVDNGGINQRMSTTLNYLQIPILFSLNSWYEETGNFYHVSVQAGPYYSRLFGISSTNPGIEPFTDNFNKTDLGVLVGVQYRINKQISAAIRYDQSLTKIYNNPSNGITGLISYLVSLRMEYYF